MLNWGEQPIDRLMVGEMGIKTAAIGDEIIYARPGGYICLELSGEEEK